MISAAPVGATIHRRVRADLGQSRKCQGFKSGDFILHQIDRGRGTIVTSVTKCNGATSEGLPFTVFAVPFYVIFLEARMMSRPSVMGRAEEHLAGAGTSMMCIEMSRNEAHGGGTWAFPLCIWAPTEKEGGGRWPFWSKIRDVNAGDIILHLRGIPPSAAFVGYSTASTDGFETSERPPEPGAWSYSHRFLRADLEDFIPFERPINLTEVFDVRRSALNEYFDKNKARGKSKLNIFYVRQSGRLQCLNGAYLSEVDDELFSTLFGIAAPGATTHGPAVQVSVATGQQLAIIQARQGQANFSKELKRLYGNACCFPSCSVADSRFLVASHIARWSDNQNLRGHLGNGLCFCLMHDKAFEIGLFTLDKDFRVFINPNATLSNSRFSVELKSAHGKQIRISTVLPLSEALSEHWARVRLNPFSS